MSLYSKLGLTLFVLLVLFGLFLVHIMRASSEMYQQEIAQKLNAELAAHIVDDQPLIGDGGFNHAGLEHLFHLLMVINPSIELYLLDTTGRIVGHAAPDERIKRNQVDLQPVRTYLSGKAMFPLAGDDPRDHSRSKVFSAARIPASVPAILQRGVRNSASAGRLPSAISTSAIWHIARVPAASRCCSSSIRRTSA